MSRADDADASADKPADDSVTRDEDPARARDAAERRKRARIFGDVLPEGTSDEVGSGWGDREGSSEDWLKGQVPPHHG